MDNLRFYRGKSMKGTFRIGDRLELEQVSINKIKKGDVIIFQGINKGGEQRDLVHRVISISEHGLVTRGDNNFYKDKALVTNDNLIGRVTHIYRNGQKVLVKGGKSGFRRARFLHLRLPVKKMIWGVCKIPYKILKESGLVSRIWRPDIKKVVLKTDQGSLVKFISGNRTVAQWWPDEGRFYCKKPFDLIIKREVVMKIKDTAKNSGARSQETEVRRKNIEVEKMRSKSVNRKL